MITTISSVSCNDGNKQSLYSYGMDKSIGKRIKELLLAKNGGNQSELAKFVGVTPQAVQQWISGETAPRGSNLKKAAEFLSASPAYISYGITEARDPHNNTYNVTKISDADNRGQALEQLSKLLGCDMSNISDDKLNLLRQAAGLKEEDVDKANKIFNIIDVRSGDRNNQKNNGTEE